MTLGHHGPFEDQTQPLFFWGGPQHGPLLLLPQTQKYNCDRLSRPLPAPRPCQLPRTPVDPPAPAPTTKPLSCPRVVCARPLLSIPPPVRRPSLPWFPRHSRAPHTIGTAVGPPQKEPGTQAGAGGETGSAEHPFLLPQLGPAVRDDTATGVGLREACFSCHHCPPVPQYSWHASLLPLPPARRPAPHSAGAGGGAGGQERPHPARGPWP